MPTDDFNRGTAAMGANWTQLILTMTLVSNRVRVSAVNSSGQACYYNGTFGSNQYSQCAMYSFPAGHGLGIGPLVRCKETDSFYQFDAELVVSSNTYLIVSNVGSGSILSQVGTITWVNADTARIEVKGTSPSVLVGYRNGAIIQGLTITDSTYVGQGNPGLGIWVDATGGTPAEAELDDFDGGDIPADILTALTISEAQFPKMILRNPLQGGRVI